MNHKHPFIFTGVATALITPFADGGIDRESFRRLVRHQIESGVSALVVCGTTGEAATLKEVERDLLLTEALEEGEGRIPIIAGCGTNNTEESVALARRAAALGADGLLMVTPYYNKGTREGVRTHFLRVAESAHLPIILYNVPSRTGVDLSCEDYAALNEHPAIVGIKEASSDVEKAAWLCRALGRETAVYAGNDSLLLPYLSLGGAGIVSVISNLFPSEMVTVCSLYAEGRTAESRALFFRLLPLIRLLFEETNPAPVKYAMARTGYGTGEVRLPLCTVGEGLRRRLERELAAWQREREKGKKAE